MAELVGRFRTALTQDDSLIGWLLSGVKECCLKFTHCACISRVILHALSTLQSSTGSLQQHQDTRLPNTL